MPGAPHPEENEFILTSEDWAIVRTASMNTTHHASWIWNEDALTYLPPSNPPDDGNPYMWNEATKAWVAYSG